jgi:hypothetical protein
MTILQAIKSLNEINNTVRISFSDFEKDKSGYMLAGTWEWFSKSHLCDVDIATDALRMEYILSLKFPDFTELSV